MGLLTNGGPPEWHPASSELKERCQEAANICRNANVELGKLAMHHFCKLDGPATFLVGMQTPELVHMNTDVFLNGLNEAESKLLNELKEKYARMQ